jgi:hypothetical protein
MRGGDSQISLAGDFVLTLTDTDLEGANEALRVSGVRLEMARCSVSSRGGAGTGIRLASVSGFIHNSLVAAWEAGIVIGDGGCSRYSDLEIGESLLTANDIGNAVANLRLEQPEPVAANLNFWGTDDCESALSRILGQDVDRITDSLHERVITCPGTPVAPVTWGVLKQRYSPVPEASGP